MRRIRPGVRHVQVGRQRPDARRLGSISRDGDDKDEYDADTAGSGVGQADGTSVSFAVIKLRPYLQGTVYKPWAQVQVRVRTRAVQHQRDQ